jgi:glutamate-1-semialdehyde 2,1-aminomutase
MNIYDSFVRSTELLARAKKVIPSASQTYSKSYRYYCEGAAPAFIERGEGCRLWDVDGNCYIDYLLALGPVTLGYCDPIVDAAIERQLRKGIVFSQSSPLEVELAEKLVNIIPSAEMVRFVKNGSDATSAAVRLARAYTGRDLILSCGYHGMQDWYIGASENNLGVPMAVQSLINTFPYNDAAALDAMLQDYSGQVAAVIMEPVRTEEPQPGYLEKVRALVDSHGALLIFDEVVTGFRVALGGAQSHYGVTPDLTALGKGLANGMPLSAVVGRSDIMRLADEGAFVSLTFGGETLSLAAALATIEQLQERNVFTHTWALGRRLHEGMVALVAGMGLGDVAYVAGTKIMPGLFFKPCGDASANDVLSLFQQEVISRGVLFLGVNYLCASHSEADIDFTLSVFEEGLAKVALLRQGVPLSALLRGQSYRPVFKRNKT